MAAKSSPTNEPKDGGSGFQPLPFDPKGKKKKESVAKVEPKATKQSKVVQPSKVTKASRPKNKATAGIPEVVSKRMARRMALFCGLPTLMGLATFPISYTLFQRGVELPNVAVLLVSLGGLGLGVLGLSYGVLSASWDEESAGSAVGWNEFMLNLGRMREGWKEARDRKK
jgi:hypothetical protein